MSTKRARSLRKNSTDAERALWRQLRARRLSNAKFRRLQPIGPYIADFICFEAKLIVEVDGGQHADEPPARQRFMENAGYRVLRFWNDEVLLNIEGVMRRIAEALRDQSPSP